MAETAKSRNAARDRSLCREIVLALLFKITVLAALYFAFFGPAHRAAVTPAAIAAVFGLSSHPEGAH
jgi:hypothetical protein